MANRVGWKCSNPNCRKATRGAGTEKTDVINIGVAAHITAASKGGPRYDEDMTAQERKSSENGIWLCQSCSKLIDSDVKRYPVDKLKKWKEISEQMAVLDLEEVVDKTDEDKELIKYFKEVRRKISYCKCRVERETRYDLRYVSCFEKTIKNRKSRGSIFCKW